MLSIVIASESSPNIPGKNVKLADKLNKIKTNFDIPVKLKAAKQDIKQKQAAQ